MLGLAGVTAIDRSAAGVTVSTVDPAMPFSIALIVDVTVASVVARPCEPAALDTVATAVALEAQVTWPVRSCVELSENVPVAVNCRVRPLARLGLACVTAIDCKVAVVTVITVEPLI